MFNNSEVIFLKLVKRTVYSRKLPHAGLDCEDLFLFISEHLASSGSC